MSEDKSDIICDSNKDILKENNIQVDFLLDSEKEKLQQELIKSLQQASSLEQQKSLQVTPNPIEKKEEPERVDKSSSSLDYSGATSQDEEIVKQMEKENKIKELNKSTKLKLIQQFVELQAAANDNQYSAHKLKNMKKDEIIKLIANYSNDKLIGSSSSQQTTETTTPVSTSVSGISSVPAAPSCNVEQLNAVANGIFNINLAMVSLLETGSHALKAKTGNVALLENWTQNVTQKKEAFIFIFKQIYKDYKCEIDKYLSPIAQYAIIMSQSAMEVVITNIKKNKEQSQEQSK